MARTRSNPAQQQSTALNSATITSDFSTTSTTYVAVTGLSVTVTVPAGRSLKITAWALDCYQTAAGGVVRATLWDGAVNTGTQISMSPGTAAASTGVPMSMVAVQSPTAGATKTYNVGFKAGSGTGFLEAAATYPAILLVEAL